MASGHDRQVQRSWSTGMFRSVAPELIPEDGAYDITNGLLGEDGAVFRRGASTYYSTTALASPAFMLWDGYLANGGQTTFVARAGAYATVSSVGVVSTVAGTGVTKPGRPVSNAGILYLPNGQTYNGLTVGTAAATGEYVAVVAERLLVASGDRVNFSGINTFGTFGVTDYHVIPEGGRIIGLEGLRDSAMVFTETGIWMIGGMASNLTDAAGNVQHRIDRYSSEIVLWGDAGIAGWAGGLVVPGTDGVWIIQLGVASEAPQAFEQISGPIDNLYREYVSQGFTPGQAVVHQGHYFLPILNGTNVVDVLVCRLDVPGRPWTHLSGFGARVIAYSIRSDAASHRPTLLGSSSGGRILNLNYFRPSEASDTDADGSSYQWSLTTRDYSTGRYVANTVVKLRASYQLSDIDGFDPTISAYLHTTRPLTTTVGSKWGQFTWGTDQWSAGGLGQVALESIGGPAPENPDGNYPFTWRLRKKARFVRFQLVAPTTSSWLSLRGLELIVRSDGRI